VTIINELLRVEGSQRVQNKPVLQVEQSCDVSVIFDWLSLN
jgi:hypothetical protein